MSDNPSREPAIHSCHAACPCHKGGEPLPDFIGSARMRGVHSRECIFNSIDHHVATGGDAPCVCGVHDKPEPKR